MSAYVIRRKLDDHYAKLDKTWYWAEWVWNVNDASVFNKKEKAISTLYNKLIGNRTDYDVVEIKLSVVNNAVAHDT